MKWVKLGLKILLALVCGAIALYCWLILIPPAQYLFPAFFILIGVIAVIPNGNATARKVVLRLAGFKWTKEDFCRGWLITGDTGSGKTSSGIVTIAEQIYRNDDKVGGMVIDDKGVLHETFSAILRAKNRENDLILLQCRPEYASADWKPIHKFNLLSDESIPPNTFAKLIVDTATSVQGGDQEAFFKTNSQLQIGKAIESLRLMGQPCTLKTIYEFLTIDTKMDEYLNLLAAVPDDKQLKAADLITHWFEGYKRQPPEQLGGVKSSITNYLQFFTVDEISEIFCPSENTFDFGRIDDGALICVSMPQKYQTERRYIATLLKILYYVHVLRRFDQSSAQRKKNNMLILWADEAQNFVTQTEGISDHSTVDRIREAGATVVAATQSQTSFFPPLTKEKAQVFVLNLRNRLIFKSADEECGKESADFIGQRKIVKRSWGYSGGKPSVNYNHEDQHYFKPYMLRKLPNHVCIINHCQKGFKKRKLPPRNPDGTVCEWYKKL
jgi:type IV secretory pathway TraG/TraD family ATPase VirD4